MENLAIFCADVGSIKNQKFGWAAFLPGEHESLLGTDIEVFANLIAKSISSSHKVTLGFECPMFVPARKNPILVNSARLGEGNRSWSAGAGTGALATGLVEYLWVFARITEILGYSPNIQFDWNEFLNSDSVFVWEAFVTSTSKGAGHAEDAAIAVDCFNRAISEIDSISAIKEESVLSLVGAAALKAGWSTDVGLLSKSCVVIKA
ncbi:hypothetical protein [Microbulbifer sp. SSSA005]|uniref:hypothetical protein n=1 Tax=Microbulbifer sp. SSSA005 TaxID=3243378 RepID=UPI0040394BEA